MGTHKTIKSDSRRQATAPIRGYAYQMYQSIYAWIKLKDNQTIVLEGAEDFDIYDEKEVATVQVKDTFKSGNLTLRSKDIVDAIKHFWECQKKNKEFDIYFRYLTTSNKGYEKDYQFPDKSKGLDYWDQCKDEIGDVKVLVEFLSTVSLPKDLLNFIKVSEPKEVLNKLIRRISWDTGRNPSDAIEAAIDNKIAFDCNRLCVPISETSAIKSVLLKKVIETITTNKLRVLGIKDYLEILEKETMVSVSRKQFNFLQSANILEENFSSIFKGVQQLPSGFGQLACFSSKSKYNMPELLKGASKRESIVHSFVNILNKHKILILNGSTGTGKSTVALLLTKKVKGNWNWLNLRSVDHRQISNLLSSTAYLLEKNELEPFLVIDDIDIRHFKEYDIALQSLLFKIKSENGRVIITTQRESPDQLFIKLWLTKECGQEAPYFNENEICELIRLHGCDDKKQINFYSKVILVTTNVGHPQLCHARVRHLQSKRWPKLSTKDIISPVEIKKEKENFRQQLLAELPSIDARNLLYRLSIFAGYFKKNVAISLGTVEPKVGLPGESFENLVGPWVERVGEEFFRITPLLVGAVHEIFNIEQVKSIQIAAANGILKQNTLTPPEISDALAFSLASGSGSHLVWISYQLLKMSYEEKKMIAEYLFWFGLLALDKGEKIYKENPCVNSMLRTIQYDIVASSGKRDSVINIAQRWFDDINDIDILDIKQISKIIYYLKLLFSIEVPFDFKLVFDALINITKSLSEAQNKHKIYDDTFDIKDQIIKITEIQVARIKSVETLSAFVDALDSIDESDQRRIIENFRKCDSGLSRTSFSTAWISELKKEKPDFKNTIRIFEQAAQKGLLWDYEMLSATAYETISIIHDEHLHDPQKAFNTIDKAIENLGSNYILENQRSRIYFGLKDYKNALKIWESIIPKMKKLTTFTTVGSIAFSERLAGISSAKLGNWEKAANFFKSAAKSAESGTREMKVGCQADEAFALWKCKSKRDSLKKLIIVIEGFNQLPDPNNNLPTYALKKRIGHMVSWMNQDQRKKYIVGHIEPPPGCASNPDADEEFKNYPLVPDAFLWSLIYEMEIRLGIDIGVSEKFNNERKKIDSPVLNMAAGINGIQNSFKKLDFDNLIDDFKELRFNYYASIKLNEGANNIFDDTQNIRLTDNELSSEESKASLYYLILSAIVSIIVRKELKNVPLKKWKEDCTQHNLLNEQLRDFFDKLPMLFSKPTSEITHLINDRNEPFNDRYIACLKVSIEGDDSPEMLFIANITLLFSFNDFEWKESFEVDFEKAVIKCWKYVIKNQRFALRMPTLTIPAIQQACDGTKNHGLAKVALVLLEAFKAINITLDDEQKKKLMSIAGETGKIKR